MPHASNRSAGLDDGYMQGKRVYLSKLGRGFQILLQAAEGGIVVFEVCARGLAAAAPQIAGHGMRNAVVHVVSGAGAVGRDARLRNAVRTIYCIACMEEGVGVGGGRS